MASGKIMAAILDSSSAFKKVNIFLLGRLLRMA